MPGDWGSLEGGGSHVAFQIHSPQSPGSDPLTTSDFFCFVFFILSSVLKITNTFILLSPSPRLSYSAAALTVRVQPGTHLVQPKDHHEMCITGELPEKKDE